MSRTVRSTSYVRPGETRRAQPRPSARRTGTRAGILAATIREGQ